MSTQRKRYSAEFKARVALDAVKGLKTVNELASTYGCIPPRSPTGNISCKKRCPTFSQHDATSDSTTRKHSKRSCISKLGNSGRVGLAEKKLDLPPEAKRELIEAAHPQISIARQCDLVGLPVNLLLPYPGESAENLTLMRLLDQQYTDTPYYGIRRMTAWLRSQGYAVNHKRVARLLHTMGLETIYPKPRLSQPHPAHRVYPYLLRGVPITQVGSVPVTGTSPFSQPDMPQNKGFCASTKRMSPI